MATTSSLLYKWRLPLWRRLRPSTCVSGVRSLNQKSCRDVFFDVAKAFAIGLVVVGHALSINGVATKTFVGNFIIGMNMPLFFFISGYFSYSTLAQADFSRFKRHIRSYLWPLAFVSCLFAVLAIPLGLTNIVKAPIYAIKYFLFPLWYVWTLCIMYTMAFVSCCFFSRLKCRLMTMGLFFLALFFLPCGTWYVTNVRAMFPFFVMGAFMLRVMPLWKLTWVGGAARVIYLFLCCVEGNINTNGMSFYMMSTHWRSLIADRWSIPLFVARILNGFVGSIGVLWAIDWMTRQFPRLASWFAIFGTTTLGVYLLHQWILYRLVEIKPVGTWGAVIIAGAVWLFCHFLVSQSKRHSLFRVVIWGMG